MHKIILMVPIMLFAFETAQDLNLGPLTGLLANLGSAGAAVIVVIYFLSYVKEQGKTIESLKNMILDMQKSYLQSNNDMSNKFVNRQEELQDFFEKQLRTVTAGQNDILRETILTVKALEKTLDTLRNDIQLILIKARPRGREDKEVGSDDDIKKLGN